MARWSCAIPLPHETRRGKVRAEMHATSHATAAATAWLAIFVPCTPAAAQDAAVPAIVLSQCDADPSASEAADQNVVAEATAAISRGGYATLAQHLPALREVMARAPSCYPLIERRGDRIIVRTDDPEEYLVLTALASQAAQDAGIGDVGTAMQANTYPMASLLLAAHAVEVRQFDHAIAWLDAGLALQPHNQYLILERVAALMGLRRFADAATLLQASLDNGAMALTLNRPRFLRSLGVALIDLGRLDEAEAALRESIRLQPDNPTAQAELDYVAQLRSGGAQRDLRFTSPAQQPQQPTPKQR
jgi:tetratricopeptide (TPR) repeat protein